MVDLFLARRGIDDADKVQLFISYAMQLVLFVFILHSFYTTKWFLVFVTTGILVLTFLPNIIRKTYNMFLPVEFDLITILFVFTALFLGEVHAYYTRFWWWDIVLHTSSGFLLGIGGFLLMYILSEEKRVHLTMKPGFVAVFGFAFALMIGAVWEIMEFSLDTVFSWQMQKNLVDTMWDLIVDALGALVISLLGYFYLKKGGFLLFDRMIHRFVERNPRLFRKKRSGV